MHTLLIHQVFTPPDEPGGTRHYELSRHYLSKGHRMTVVASNLNWLTGSRVDDKRGLVNEYAISGLRVLRCYTHPALHKNYFWRVVSFVSFMFSSLIGSLRAGRLDVVMGTSPPIFQALSAWLIALYRRRPFLLEIRDLWPEFAIDIGVLRNAFLIAVSRAIERFLYAHATHILVNSPAYRDYLERKGISPEKITLIPNGVDSDMFDPDSTGDTTCQRLGLKDKFIVTYAGSLGLANDIETILMAAEILQDDPDIHFLIVGGGKEQDRLRLVIDQVKLRNVTLTGTVPKSLIPEYLAASHACIATLKDIPMFRTTYPNKVFDYMAAGRPTILGIDGVIREVVVDRAQAGIFVQPGNHGSLAAAVRRLKTNRNEAKLMGLAARKYVVEHFNRQDQALDFTNLLETLTP